MFQRHLWSIQTKSKYMSEVPEFLPSRKIVTTSKNPTASETAGITDCEPPLQCLLCSKSFYGVNKKFLLNRHMITHTGEKPFQCPQCPYRANVSSNLTRHIRSIHSIQVPLEEILTSTTI